MSFSKCRVLYCTYYMLFSAAIFLLSGLVNVVLFTVTRHGLPSGSIGIGSWSTSFSEGFPPTDEQGHEPYRNHTHTRSGSQSSSDTIVAGSIDQSVSGQPRKTKQRPPEITIRRDSIDSMYSVYDEEMPDMQHNGLQPPPVSSHWSPDGSPQHR